MYDLNFFDFMSIRNITIVSIWCEISHFDSWPQKQEILDAEIGLSNGPIRRKVLGL